MARAGYKATITTSLGGGQYAVDVGPGGSALAAAVAVAVADAAAPTQAHVTAIDAALTAAGDVLVSYDTTAVTNINQLSQALAAVLRQARF